MTAELSQFDVWYAVFLKAYHDPSSVSSLHCPRCGEQSLNLIFQGRSVDAIRAIRIFWCGSCMYGLAPNLTPAKH